jgi:hypothetical protein
VNYRDHPLLEGFKDLPNDKLIEVAVAQLEMAAWIGKGAKFGKEGMVKEVREGIVDGLQGASRTFLEKFLYHAIVIAVKANDKARGRDEQV